MASRPTGLLRASRELLGEGPYPVALPELPLHFDLSASESVLVIATRDAVRFTSSGHAHAGYEFLIPLSGTPTVAIGPERIDVTMGRTLPLNAWQEHGLGMRSVRGSAVAVKFTEEAMRTLARDMAGRSAVHFANEVQPVDPRFMDLVRTFAEESRGTLVGRDLILESLGVQMGVHLIRQLKTSLPVPEREKAYSAKRAIRRAMDYLLATEDGFSLQGAAMAANLSPYHFIRVFKAETGHTPYQWLIGKRVQEACVILKASSLSVTEVAYRCGFSSPSHFTRVFRRHMRVSPSDYRRHHA